MFLGFIWIEISNINAAAIIASSILPYINPITTIAAITNVVINVFFSSWFLADPLVAFTIFLPSPAGTDLINGWLLSSTFG